MIPKRLLVTLVSLAGILWSAAVQTDWPYYGGDQAGSKYSELTQVNRANVKNLKLAWEWLTCEKALSHYGTHPGLF